MMKKTRKTYVKPSLNIVWYGLKENMAENVGGMGATSGRDCGNDTNWVKGEKTLDSSTSTTTNTTSTNLWDEEW